jgi:hypothetical protein
LLYPFAYPISPVVVFLPQRNYPTTTERIGMNWLFITNDTHDNFIQIAAVVAELHIFTSSLSLKDSGEAKIGKIFIGFVRTYELQVNLKGDDATYRIGSVSQCEP